MRSMTRRRCSSEMNRAWVCLDHTAALDVDVFGAVDHDLGDRRVSEERLDGTEAHDVTGDLLDEALTLVVR